MKVLLVHNFYKIRAGEDIAFDATVETLRARGHELRIVTRDNAAIRGWRTWLAPFSVLFSPSAFREVRRAATDFQPDVALVQNVFPLLSPAVYLALKLARLPVAQRVFNYRLVCTNGVLFTQGEICERCVRGSYWNAVILKCYRQSALQTAPFAFSLWLWRKLGVWNWGVRLFLTPDRFLGSKILPATGDEQKTRILFNPEPTATTPRVATTGSRLREVLFVGRWVREKGILTAVRTAAQVPEIPFRFVGKGEDGEEARRLASELGARNVEWVGPVYGADLQARLDTAGALIVPSEWYDNMPLILTQALLSGIPIVASRINGIPEFIIDGETGRLAEPGSPDSFAAAVRAVFAESGKSAQMAQEGRKRGENWFSQARFGARLEEALASVASKSDFPALKR